MRKVLFAAVAMALFAAMPAAGTTSASSDSLKAQHVKRFVLHDSAVHQFGANRNAGTDELRHGGKLVGYDSFTNYSDFDTRIVFRFALALKHGQIVGRVVQEGQGPREGTILFGTGRFAGIEGTTAINIDRHNRQHLVLRYQL